MRRGKALVHSVVRIRKHAVGQYSGRHPRNVAFHVIPMHGNQSQQAAANLTDGLIVDRDVCATHALQQGNHFWADSGFIEQCGPLLMH